MRLAMIKTPFVCWALLGCLIAGATRANAALSQEFFLNGVVLAATSRQPLAGVKIEVFQPSLGEHGSATGRNATQTLTTGADGHFELNSLSPGPATIIFSKVGFQSVRYDLDFIGRSGIIASATILMWRPEISSMPCGGLVQPGQTANVYVVCASTR